MSHDDIWQHRRDVTSALYFLVWHCGLSYDAAENFVIDCRRSLTDLANAGRVEGNPCFSALRKLADTLKQDFPQVKIDRHSKEL